MGRSSNPSRFSTALTVLIALAFGTIYSIFQGFCFLPVRYASFLSGNQLALERVIDSLQKENLQTMLREVGPEYIDAFPNVKSWANTSFFEHDTVTNFDEWEAEKGLELFPPLKSFSNIPCSRGTHVFFDGFTSIYSVYHDHRGMTDANEKIALRVIGACRRNLCRGLTFHHPKTDEELDLIDTYSPPEHTRENHRPVMLTVDATLLFREDSIENVHPRRTDKNVKICFERPVYDFESKNDFEDIASWTDVDPSLNVSPMTPSTYRDVDKGEYEGFDPIAAYWQPQVRPKKTGQTLELRRYCRTFPILPTSFQFTYLPSDVTSNAPPGDEDQNVNPNSAFFPKLLKFKGIKGGPHRPFMTEIEETEFLYREAIKRGDKPSLPSSLDDSSIPRWNTFPTYPYDKDLLTADNGYPDEFHYDNRANDSIYNKNSSSNINDTKEASTASEVQSTSNSEEFSKSLSYHSDRFGRPVSFANDTQRVAASTSPYWSDLTSPSPPMSLPSQKNNGIAMCLKGWWDGPVGKGNPKNLVEYFGYYKLMGVKKIFMYCSLDEKVENQVRTNSWYESKKIRREVSELLKMIRERYSPKEFDVEIICNNYGSVNRRITANGKKFGPEQKFMFEAQTIINIDCHYRASKYLLIMPHVDVDEFLSPSVFSKEQFENPRSLLGLVMEETELGEARSKRIVQKKKEKLEKGYDFFSFVTYFPTSKLSHIWRSQLGLDDIERALRDPRRGGYTAVKPTEKGIEVFTERLKKNVERDEQKFLAWVKGLTRSFPVGVFCAANTFHFYHWINRKEHEFFPSAIALPYAQARPGHHFAWDRAKCLVLQTATPASTIHDMMHSGFNSVQLMSAPLLMERARTHHYRAPTYEFLHRFASRIREGHITDFSFWWYKKGVTEFARRIGADKKNQWVDDEVWGSNDANNETQVIGNKKK